MGGVVNVITRAPVAGAWSAAAVATAGDQGRRDVSVSALGGVGPVRGVVDVGRRAIELAPGRPGEGGGALSERWDGRARLGWDAPVEGLRLEVAGLLLDERQSWRSGQLGHFADNTQWTGRLTGTLDRGRHALSATFFATAFEHLSRRARGAEPLPGTGQFETQALMEGELIWGMDLGDHALDAGVEVTRETIDSERVLGGRRTERTAEPFVQTTLNWGGVSVVPGIRGSWSNLWGGQWTPRLAALWRPRPELGLRASVGQGFRAPSFKELSMQFLNVGPGFGYAVRGNADLRPELSRNATVSVEWAGDRSWVRVQGYENQFDDFIETQMVGDSSGVEVYSYGNIDDGFTRGLELEAGGRLGAWNLEGGLNLLRAEQRETGEALLGRPSRSGRGTLGWASMDGLRLSVTGVWTGRTPIRRTEERTDYRPDFLRFDARAAWRLPGGLELVLGVDNLLDERLEEWPGFTGRHLYTSVAWRAAGGG
jgi:outer membrane receptor for ferrienterochelin and colicins